MSGRRADRAGGFTLVEVVSAMVVIAVISVVSSRVVLTAADQYVGAASRAELSAEASAAMTRMTTELRDIPLSTAWSAALTSMSTTSVGWNDVSGACSLQLLDGQIVFSDPSRSAVLLRNVSSFTLRGYDEKNTVLSATPTSSELGRLRRIEITVGCTRSGVTETLRTRVFLRMFTCGAST